MKKKIGIVLVVFTVIVSCAGKAYPIMDLREGWLPEKAEWMPDFSLSSAFMTKYIWRGWNLGDEPVMQLDASASKWGFTFDWWANYSLNNDKSRDSGRYQEFTEIDYTIDYTLSIGEMSEKLNFNDPDFLNPLSISAGYVYYTFPNIDWSDKFFDSHEVYLSCSYDVFFQPFFTWYWDVGRGKGNSDGGGDGSYFLFGIGHTFSFEKSGISVDIGATTGIIDEQWTNKTGWADMVFSGAAHIPVFNYFTITPNIAYSLILDRDTYNNASENEFYGGIGVSFKY